MHPLACTDCHQGNAEASAQDAAHKGLYANPSDLRVVDDTCGVCHEKIVLAVGRSLHATMAGMISGTRYDFGAQGREAIYGTYAVAGGKADAPGAVESLKAIRFYDPSKPEGPENSMGDDYLRNQCLRCHLWSDGHQRDGDWRASGCAACHVEYSDAGTYEGSDPAIPKGQKDRPRFHRMTSRMSVAQCIHCHNRGGRTGVSFTGTMESDKYGSPWKPNGRKQGTLHGKQYNHLMPDIHYERGMTCIDCHTALEMHGDGRIYSKKEGGVEIRCVSCHGTVAEPATFKTAWGNALTNVTMKDGVPILTANLTGKEHEVPQLSSAELTPVGEAAMVSIPAHMEKLECSACHARWAPQCYGCHAVQDVSKPAGDWLNGKITEDPTKTSRKENRRNTAFSWSETRSYLRWESPILGINHRGKVSPFITGCQAIVSQVDGGKNLITNKTYTTVHGTSGLAHNQIQPHTISTKSRSCVDCHANPKTFGLGSGYYEIKANFPDGSAPVDFELERIVDESGKQLQATNHEGSRPFNKQEMERISRVGTCLACHSGEPVKLAGSAPSDELHTRAIRRLLKARPEK